MNLNKTVRVGIWVGVVAVGLSGAWGQEREISVSGGLDVVSKYLWRGYDVFDDHAAWQPYAEAGWRGFYVGVWGSFSMSRGFENLDELDYYIGYGRTFMEGERWQIDGSATYTYYDFPNSDSDTGPDGVGDVQEIGVSLSLPRLLPVGDIFIVPSYSAYYDWSGKQGGDDIDNGWFHTFALSTGLPIDSLPLTQEGQTLDVSWDLTYNDGVFGSESDWSHTTLTVGTSYSWEWVSVGPSVAYQWSLEDTVDHEDEWLFGLSASVSF